LILARSCREFESPRSRDLVSKLVKKSHFLHQLEVSRAANCHPGHADGHPMEPRGALSTADFGKGRAVSRR
jgi:hypothetical protein